MAMPTSAAARAGASLMPSPAIATVRPAACNSRTTACFPSGFIPARNSSIPSPEATVRAVSSLSPVSMMIRSPSSWRLRTASGVEGLIGSETAISPASRPSTATRITVRPCRWSPSARSSRAARSATPSSASQPRLPISTARPSTLPRAPPPVTESKSATAGTGRFRAAAPATIARANGCSLCCSTLAA